MVDLTLQQKIVNFARGKTGQQVGGGECTDLVDEALKASGGKTLYELGESDQQHPNDKDRAYVWGAVVKLTDVTPGDILQFADHKIVVDTDVTVTFDDKTTVISQAEGSTTDSAPRRHHTAIATSKPDKDGVITTLEQNVDFGTAKTTESLSFRTRGSTTTKTERKMWPKPSPDKALNGKPELATVKTVVTITITGTVVAYHPTKK